MKPLTPLKKFIYTDKPSFAVKLWQISIDLFPCHEPGMVNVFCTNRNPVQSARELPDYLVPRMCLESAQILCAVHWSLLYHGKETPEEQDCYDDDPPWRRTLGQRKHPVCIWAGRCLANYQWVLRYFEELAAEYKIRYPERKEALSAYTTCHKYLHQHRNRLVPGGYNFDIKDLLAFQCFTEHEAIKRLPLPATGQYKVLMIYKYAYLHTKTPKWTNRELPSWLHDERIHRWLRNTYGKPIRKLQGG